MAKKRAEKPHGNKPGKISNKDYEKELKKLQSELVKLQIWVKERKRLLPI